MKSNLQTPDITPHTSLLGEFLESLQAGTAAANTVRAYRADVDRFMQGVKVRGMDITQLSARDIEQHFRQLASGHASAPSIKRARVSLKSFFRFLFENGTIPANPFEDPTLDHAFTDTLTLSSILTMMQHLRRRCDGNDDSAFRARRDELILLLSLLYGLRQYHCTSCKLSDLKREGESVLLRVTDELMIKLEGVVLKKLCAYLVIRKAGHPALFVEPKGEKALTSRSLHALMIELSYVARVQVNPKSLYHTYLHLQKNPDDASRLVTELEHLEDEPS